MKRMGKNLKSQILKGKPFIWETKQPINWKTVGLTVTIELLLIVGTVLVLLAFSRLDLGGRDSTLIILSGLGLCTGSYMWCITTNKEKEMTHKTRKGSQNKDQRALIAQTEILQQEFSPEPQEDLAPPFILTEIDCEREAGYPSAEYKARLASYRTWDPGPGPYGRLPQREDPLIVFLGPTFVSPKQKGGWFSRRVRRATASSGRVVVSFC